MAQTFPLAGYEIEHRQRLERQKAQWKPHEDARRFIRDWYPELLEPLVDCRSRYKLERSLSTDDKYRLRPRDACWKVPFCIPCTQIKGRGRTQEWMDRFAYFTPKGKPMRAIHIVMTAPLREDGTGWGAKAMHNLTHFFNVVWKTLEEWYGTGIGGVLSYQDFGEQPFTKSHPHIDLTLNGWRLVDGKPQPIPQLDLMGGGNAARSKTYQKHAFSFDLEAIAGNFKVGHIFEGAVPYRAILAYQLRELVDLRKITYSADGRKVGWRNYKDNSVDWTPAERFNGWYEEYKARVKPDKANRLHRPRGYMEMNPESAWVKETFGGEPNPHRVGCACKECDSWERVYDEASLGGERSPETITLALPGA